MRFDRFRYTGPRSNLAAEAILQRMKIRIEFHPRSQRYLWAYDTGGIPVWHDGGASVDDTKARVEDLHRGRQITYTVSP